MKRLHWIVVILCVIFTESVYGLHGEIEFDNSNAVWSQDLKDFVTEAHRQGKAATVSEAFEQCVMKLMKYGNDWNEDEQSFKYQRETADSLPWAKKYYAYAPYFGPHVQCAKDPFYALQKNPDYKYCYHWNFDECEQEGKDCYILTDYGDEQTVVYVIDKNGSCGNDDNELMFIDYENRDLYIDEQIKRAVFIARKPYNISMKLVDELSEGPTPGVNSGEKCGLCYENNTCNAGFECVTVSSNENVCHDPNESDNQCIACPHLTAWAGFNEFDENKESFKWSHGCLMQKKLFNDFRLSNEPSQEDYDDAAIDLSGYARVSAVIWHEVFHNNDYHHEDRFDCRILPEELGGPKNYFSGHDSVINIVGACVSNVINQSYRCPSTVQCGEDEFPVIDAWPPQTDDQQIPSCTCVSIEEDRDHDGVLDKYDNCPPPPIVLSEEELMWYHNPYEKVPPNSEFISAPCEHPVADGEECTVGGASEIGDYYNPNGYYSPLPDFGVISVRGYHYQPDSDLDGVGDKCDFTGKFGGEGYASVKIKDEAGQFGWLEGGAPDDIVFDKYRAVQLQLDAKESRSDCQFVEYGGVPFGKCPGLNKKVAMFFCGVRDYFYYQWGQDGSCTNSDKTEKTFYRPPVFDFGFSHGTDDYALTEYGTLSWYETSWAKDSESIDSMEFYDVEHPLDYETEQSQAVIELNSRKADSGKILWNWRRDAWKSIQCSELGGSYPICDTLKNYSSAFSSANTFYHTLSVGVVPDDMPEDTPYIANVNGSMQINPDFFFNSKKYARSHRFSKAAQRANAFKITLPVQNGINISEYIGLFNVCPICSPDEDDFSDITVRDRSLVNVWSTDILNGDIVFSKKTTMVEPATEYFFQDNSGHLFSVTEHEDGNGEVYHNLNVSYAEGSPDWMLVGKIRGWPENFNPTSSLVEENAYEYTTGINDAGETVTYRTSAGIVIHITGYEEDAQEEKLYRIKTENGYLQFAEMAFTGLDNLNPKKFVQNGNGIYLFGTDGDQLKTYLLDKDNSVFSYISMVQVPPARSIFNVISADGNIYLAGGIDSQENMKRGIWKFDTASTTPQWTKIADMQGDVRKLMMKKIGNEILMINFISNGVSYPAVKLNTDDLSLSYPFIPAYSDFVTGNEICLRNDSYSVKAGVETNDGCVPFTTENYDFHEMNEEVNDVAGYRNYLFVSSDDSVKIVDVSDFGAVSEVVDIPTGFVVNDIEINGSVAYVTVNNGIASYDISDVNNIVLLDYIVTYDNTNFLYSYQGVVTDSSGNPVQTEGTLKETEELFIMGNKLYAADGHGITVLDITDPDNLVIESSVYTSGNAETIAVSDNRIYTYDRMGLKIYDRNTLDQLYADYEGILCSNAEYTYYDNVWYAGCGVETYVIEEDGWDYEYNSIEGDVVELRDSYAYGRLTFFPEGTGIRASYFDPSAPVCGNGVIEEGEICDSNSVECTTLSGDYIDGTASCNSTCSGYNENNCEEDDGW